MRTIICIFQQLYAWFFLLVCFGCMSVVTYWLFIQPSNVLSNFDGPVIVNGDASNKVIAGKTMLLDRFFCINDDKIKGTVTRTFTNHVVYNLPDTSTFTIGKGTGCREKQYVVDVPSVLPTGDYDYNVHITYEINPLKSVTFSLTPVSLHIMNPIWDTAKELAKEKK